MNTISDIDFGLCLDDLAINVVRSCNQTQELKSNELPNPFFIGLDHKSPLDDLNKKQLFTTYPRVLLMCMKNTPGSIELVNLSKIYSLVWLDADIEHLSKHFTLVSCPSKILSTRYFYKRTNQVSKKYLEKFNNSEIVLDREELVIPMYELDEQTCKLYTSQYSSLDPQSVIKLLELNGKYTCGYMDKTSSRLAHIIPQIANTNYWTYPVNCDIGISHDWNTRSFYWKDMVRDRIHNLVDFQHKAKSAGYLIEAPDALVTGANNQDNFVDLANALKSQENRTYFATIDNNNLPLKRDQITEYFLKSSNSIEMRTLFDTLLMCPKYWHMVLNNKHVLDKMGSVMKDNLIYYKYLLGPAFVSAVMEENIFKTKITKDHRFIFDINTANLLPFFPFSPDDAYQTPYLAFLVSQSLSDIANNYMGLPIYSDWTGYGIDTLDNFKWKFNIFTTGNPSTNVFDGLNWSNRFAVSGSLMTALTPSHSPMFNLVTNGDIKDPSQWDIYLNKFKYANSDIDFMCNEPTVFGFMDGIYEMKQVVEKNIGSQVETTPISTVTVVITSQYLNDKWENIGEFIGEPELDIKKFMDRLKHIDVIDKLYGSFIDGKEKVQDHNTEAQTIESFISNIKSTNLKRYILSVHELYQTLGIEPAEQTTNNFMDWVKGLTDKIKGYFHTVYLTKKTQLTEKQKASPETKPNQLYEHYWEPVSLNSLQIVISTHDVTRSAYKQTGHDMFVSLSDYNEGVKDGDDKVVLKLIENLKFKLSSPNMLRTIEAFRVKNGDFFSSVSRFHLPCVRAYYNGSNVFMTPTFITSMLTGINMDYKYFAGIRDPIEILNKNCSRGYGTIVNKTELKDLDTYNKVVEHWAERFSKEDKIFGFKDINHSLYKEPRYKGAYNEVKLTPINTLEDVKKYYKEKTKFDSDKLPIDMFKLKFINSEGKIDPLKKWIGQAYWQAC